MIAKLLGKLSKYSFGKEPVIWATGLVALVLGGIQVAHGKSVAEVLTSHNVELVLGVAGALVARASVYAKKNVVIVDDLIKDTGDLARDLRDIEKGAE